MTYEQEIDKALKNLYMHYLVYARFSKSKHCSLSEAELAQSSVDGFLEYLKNSFEDYPHWKNNIPGIIYNEIRILRGFIECYDKPVVRVAKTNKTRWSL
jgi:hypothetical protein